MKSSVLFGKGDLAIFTGKLLIDLGYEIKFVVPVIPEPNWSGSLLNWAKKNNLSVFIPDGVKTLPNENFDLGISIYYDKIIKKPDILKFGRLLNLHNSPLPRYRGVSPINWALKNGEYQHGVTLHEITPEIDQGPIVAQILFSIFPDFEEVQDVYKRCLVLGQTLLTEYLKNVNSILPSPQNSILATYYTDRDKQKLGERSNWIRNNVKLI
jgi:methionyl-tRNA formyltransferase